MKSVTQFLGEVRAEMAKVVWPSRSALLGSTIVVVILVTAFSLFLGSVDYLLSRVAGWIFLHYGMQ
jgi:preprotein translocase subunit SecE